MKIFGKIFFHDLPSAVIQGLEAQFARFGLARVDAIPQADMVVAGAGAGLAAFVPVPFLACPVLYLDAGAGVLRLGDVLSAILRALATPALHTPDMALGGGVFSPAGRRLVFEDGSVAALTDRESDMLFYLARAGGAVVMREDLLQNVWQYHEDADTHTLETHIYRLRQKMKALAGFLETDQGGYRLCGLHGIMD